MHWEVGMEHRQDPVSQYEIERAGCIYVVERSALF